MENKHQKKIILFSFLCALGVGLGALIAIKTTTSQDNANEAEIPTNDDASGERQNNTHSSSKNNHLENGTKNQRNSRSGLPPQDNKSPNTENPTSDDITKRRTVNGSNHIVGTNDPKNNNLEVKKKTHDLEQNIDQRLITSHKASNDGSKNGNGNDSHSIFNNKETVKFDLTLFNAVVKEYINDETWSAEEKKNLLAENELSYDVISKLAIMSKNKIDRMKKNERARSSEEENVDRHIDCNKLKVYYIPATIKNREYDVLEASSRDKKVLEQNVKIRDIITNTRSYFLDKSPVDGVEYLAVYIFKNYLHSDLVLKPYYYQNLKHISKHNLTFFIFAKESLVGYVDIKYHYNENN